MKGNEKILEKLNELLTAELTAINQYFVHAKMCANWGYQRTAKQKHDESIDEMKDADKIIDRILYLDGVPNMQRLNPVMVGESVAEMHRVDLELERAQVGRLNETIALCRDLGDNGTRALCEEILRGEESAVDFLEAQLGIIEKIGEERYLAEHIHD